MNVSPLVLKSKLSLGLWGETLVLRGHVTSSLSRKLTKSCRLKEYTMKTTIHNTKYKAQNQR